MLTFLKKIHLYLSEIYSENEINIVAYAWLEKLTGLTKLQLMIRKDLILNDDQREQGDFFIQQLKNHTPIQYLIGETEFYGLKLKVNSSVLIPRPETEELVEWIMPSFYLKGEFSNIKNGIDILDIGTGSGCIAIALKKKFPNAEITAMDVSCDALEVAKENAALNKIKINFIQADILKIDQLDKKYDVIVSNPPYIPMEEKSQMASNVVDNEPHIALFVPNNDPLVFYRKIAELAKTHLKPAGCLYFEIHKEKATDCKNLLFEYGFKNVEIRKDISGNERMICGSR